VTVIKVKEKEKVVSVERIEESEDQDDENQVNTDA
jgi:hypothetical protein